MAAALLLIAAALPVARQVREQGWIAVVPGVVLVHLLPLPDTWDFSVGSTIRNDPAWREWLERSDQFPARRRGALRELHFIAERLLTSRLARAYAGDLESLFVCRESWPAGESIWVDVIAPDWMRGSSYRRLTVTPRSNGMNPVTVGILERYPTIVRNASTHGRLEVASSIGVPPRNAGRVEFDLRLIEQTEGRGGEGAERVVWRGRTALNLRNVDSPDEIIGSLQSPEIEEALASSARAMLRVDSDRGRAHIELDCDWGAARNVLIGMDGVVLALRADVLYEGELVASGAFGLEVFPHRRGSAHRIGDFVWLSEISRRDVALLITDRFMASGREVGEWTLRLTGDPLVALRYPDARRWWAGEVIVPIEVVRLLSAADDEEDYRRETLYFRMHPRGRDDDL